MALTNIEINDRYKILQEERKKRPEREERRERLESRIKRDIRGWIGWDFIEECVKLCEVPLAVLTTFLVAGRSIEILDYNRGMFADMGVYYEARGLPVYKRYKVLSKSPPDPITGKRTYETQLEIDRRSIPIMKTEPLAGLFWDLIKDIDRGEYILQWPQRNQYWQLYKVISEIPVPKDDLAPFYHKGDKKGQQKNVYPHWFRGMRAAQLRVQYNLSVDKLCDFFKWKNIEMARHYAGLSSTDMVVAIQQGERFMQVYQEMFEVE